MNCEEMLNKQAEMVLALDPGIPGEQPRVWVYRNTIKALNWFASVREKLDDPAYNGWFVRFANYTGPSSNGSYNVPACTFEKCSGFYHDQSQTPEMGGGSHNGGCVEECDCGDAPCGEYIFDHMNASFSDWFVNEWMISNETLRHSPQISLGYLDDWMSLHGPSETNGHFIQDTGSSAQVMGAHVEAYLANMRRLEQQLVNHGGFWQGLVNHGDGDQVMNRGPQIRPNGKRNGCYHDCGNVTAAQCEATLRDVWCVADPVPWKSPTSYLMRPPSADVAKELGTQATAQFLMTRGPFAWIGFFDWQSLANWPRRYMYMDNAPTTAHLTWTSPTQSTNRHIYLKWKSSGLDPPTRYDIVFTRLALRRLGSGVVHHRCQRPGRRVKHEREVLVRDRDVFNRRCGWLRGRGRRGTGTRRNLTLAARYWRLAADQGLAAAQGSLGTAYYAGLRACNIVKARVISTAVARGGRVYGLSWVEAVNWGPWGSGAVESPFSALQVSWVGQSSKVPSKLTAVLCRYYTGEGVARDKDEAVRLWQLSAEQGHDDATRRLANLKAWGKRTKGAAA